MNTLYIIIATSLKRKELLLNTSLLSIYKQTGIFPSLIKIVIIDDNEYSGNEVAAISRDLQYNISSLRGKLHLEENEFDTILIPNSRTRHNSGTGAWNTGIYYAFQQDPDSYISILDDDDEYFPGHLSDCINVIESDPAVQGVFQEIIWKLPDGNIWNFPITLTDLTASSFFIGDPGVQCSNMFVKTSLLVGIGGFDESLPSATDRDLMIRLIRHLSGLSSDLSKVLVVLNKPGVIYHVHEGERVTSSTTKKHQGLDLFYKKYKGQFTESELRKSLNRASILFDYHGTEGL